MTDCQILHCDFQQLPLEPGSVDLIFTDPPYSRKSLPLWAGLGRFAARVLKPGGLLAAYSGKYTLPEVYASLTRHLTYQHTCALTFGRLCRQWTTIGGRPWLYLTGWRPLLLFSQGEWVPPYKLLHDTLTSPRREKTLHPWQQPISDALYYIERLTEQRDLVCDPFGGSFTSGKAAALLGRRFVGCDVDPIAVNVGKKRLAA